MSAAGLDDKPGDLSFVELPVEIRGLYAVAANVWTHCKDTEMGQPLTLEGAKALVELAKDLSTFERWCARTFHDAPEHMKQDDAVERLGGVPPWRR